MNVRALLCGVISPRQTRRLVLLSVMLAALAPVEAADYRELVRGFAAENHFNGLVLVGQGTRVDYVEAFGVADAEAGRPISPRTRFETGSISKWIASIVVMSMVDKGQLSLDAPITTYLPDYRADTGAQLTLRHLMSHTSGVPNEVIAAFRQDPSLKEQALDMPEAVKRFASGDLLFKPGEKFDYSHSNWILVKAIVERVSGQPYAELVRKVLLKPLRLQDSGIHVGDSAKVANMALGYTTLTPQPERRRSPTPNYLAMAGGYYTTAEELLRLMDGVLSGKVLSPESRKTLMTVIMPEQSYALGGRVKVVTLGGVPRTLASEYGSNGAFRVLAWRVLDDGRTLVMMNNTSFDHYKLGELADQLLPALYP